MRFIAFALTAAPILTITSISIDRFLLIAYAIKHSRLIKEKLLIIWPACIWLLGITIPAKEVIFGKQSYDWMSISCFIAITVIPSAVMYALTYFKLKKQSRKMQALQGSIESRAQKIRILKNRYYSMYCCHFHYTCCSIKEYFSDNIKFHRYISFCMLYMNFSVTH